MSVKVILPELGIIVVFGNLVGELQVKTMTLINLVAISRYLLI